MTIRMILIAAANPPIQSQSSSTSIIPTTITTTTTTNETKTTSTTTISNNTFTPTARIPVITTVVATTNNSNTKINNSIGNIQTTNSTCVDPLSLPTKLLDNMTRENLDGESSSFHNSDTQLNSSSSSYSSSSSSLSSASSISSEPPSPLPLSTSQQQQNQSQQPQQNESPLGPNHDYEFDGTTVLCRVCGDKASGFHYGVHSCEGCKGFFRRSIQQKIQYRPCTKNQQCSILRINRNRCQYCRLKKCIAVGMSRDAVRFGRVPKREKAKILAAMQKVNAHSLEKALTVLLEDETNLMQSIIKAHEETCDYTKDKVAPLLDTARSRPIYAQCPQMTCPLNPLPPNSISDNGSTTNRLMEDFSERFLPAINGVVEFAKRIPGFNMLAQEDQVTLLKAGVFEVLLVRLACMFDSQTNSMVCLNGLSLRRDSLHSASNARFLLDSMFEFAERLNSLRLTDQEIGLFCAVVVIAPDRPGLRNIDLVQKINKRLEEVLQKAIATNHHHNFHQDQSSAKTLFLELTKKIPDLRTLNALHSEKLLGKSFGGIDTSTTSLNVGGASQCPQMMIDTHSAVQQRTTTQQQQVQQQPDSQTSESPDRWSSSSSSSLLMMGRFSPSNSVDDINRRSVSPTNSSQHNHDLWMDCKDGGSFGSPRSMSSGVSSDDSSGVSRKGSISSSSASVVAATPKLAYINSYVHSLNNNKNGSSNHQDMEQSTTSSVVVSPYHHQQQMANGHPIIHHHHHQKLPRVDSPTDSGIESGKEHGSASTPTTSVCSSPQSAIEDSTATTTITTSSSTTSSTTNNRLIQSTKDHLMDIDNSNEKQETIDDMPVLKRALQAPPLVNTNKLMDEAYRHHKKFRAATRRDTEPHSPTTTTTSLSSINNNNLRSGLLTITESQKSSTPTGVITSHSSSSSNNNSSNSTLASTHSTLLKTLEQPSRYMNVEQLKRTDLIHNIIMSTEAVQTPATIAPNLIQMDSGSTSLTTSTISSSPESIQHHQKQYQYQSNGYSGKEQQQSLPHQQQQVTVLYTSTSPSSVSNSNYNNPHHANYSPSSHHHMIPVVANGGGCPFSGQNRIIHTSTNGQQYQHPSPQQSIFRTAASPPSSYLEQQSQSHLVIGSTPNAAAVPAAHSPRPSSSSSTYSNHGGSSSGGHPAPFSHLQRCLTAQIAPPMASNGPIILQAASTNNGQSNEIDCQPLNLSKKASSSLSPSPSPPLSSSSSSSNSSSSSSSGIQQAHAAAAPASSITSTMIKIEVDQNA